ncbi:uncharacterized protein A4U43_C01F12530 [Asparagus officinalis]|uniref:Glyoxal oxidase N-terminal domain-containing protein n=1 Tax=Asparagus officinalis TaxID=4686 RepID=A0A5P1FNU4_ASPOF|nr:uncharacterized protein A4U43_C01F12530 [Asparagus officinalis]
MHMQSSTTTVSLIFDRTDFGPSNLSLPDRHCRSDPTDAPLPVDCTTAHSLRYANVPHNSFRPSTVLTDTWCSSGSSPPAHPRPKPGVSNDGERRRPQIHPLRHRDHRLRLDRDDRPGSQSVAGRRRRTKSSRRPSHHHRRRHRKFKRKKKENKNNEFHNPMKQISLLLPSSSLPPPLPLEPLTPAGRPLSAPLPGSSRASPHAHGNPRTNDRVAPSRSAPTSASNALASA